MNILNDIIRGASRQFGREFGRAGANLILKGANSYTVQGISDYSGRIKPSDSSIVKAVKEIQKVKFVSANKANASRLIELTDLMLSNISFNGNATLNQLDDLKELVNQYNNKFEHGSSLIDDDFKDKSIDYLEEKRREFVELMDRFNDETKLFITTNLERAEAKKKSKILAVLLSLPLIGLQWAYLNSTRYTVFSILLCWTIIVPFINLIALIKILLLDEDKFNLKYNPETVFYKQFSTNR
jgi:TM2 domain-containing membrane protein YozV